MKANDAAEERVAEGLAARGHLFEDYIRHLFSFEVGNLTQLEQPDLTQSETDLQLSLEKAVSPAELLPTDFAFIIPAAKDLAKIEPGRIIGEIKVSTRKVGEALEQLKQPARNRMLRPNGRQPSWGFHRR